MATFVKVIDTEGQPEKIINFDHVQEFEAYGRGTYITFASGKTATISTPAAEIEAELQRRQAL